LGLMAACNDEDVSDRCIRFENKQKDYEELVIAIKTQLKGKSLSNTEVIQHGFYRNKKLYSSLQGYFSKLEIDKIVVLSDNESMIVSISIHFAETFHQGESYLIYYIDEREEGEYSSSEYKTCSCTPNWVAVYEEW